MTTPYDARRATRLRDTSEAAYQLATVLKHYPSHRKDGAKFGLSELERIEHHLGIVTALIAETVEAERKQIAEDARFITGATDVVTFRPGGVVAATAEVEKKCEPTVPVSLIDQIRTRTDCD